MALDSAPAFSRYRCGDLGLAYNELAFRHFLHIERRRAGRSSRSLLLVLVSQRMLSDARLPLGDAATAVFSVLGACVREVDFVGWFREDRVAAAVITLTGAASAREVARQIRGRVSDRLHGQLPPRHRDRLRIRVVELLER